jgi:hypothetical protein
VDLATLARAQSICRIAFGVGMLLVPGVVGRLFAGPAVADDRAKVLARGVGARDVSLGAGGVLAQRDGHREWCRRTFAAQAFADGVDLVAILAAGKRLPPAPRIVGAALAAGAAGLNGEYARRLGGAR